MNFDSAGRPLCDHCKQVLGTYEPIVLADRGGKPRLTSRAAEHLLAADAAAWHEECHARSAAAGARGGSLRESSQGLGAHGDQFHERAREIEGDVG